MKHSLHLNAEYPRLNPRVVEQLVPQEPVVWKWWPLPLYLILLGARILKNQGCFYPGIW